MAEACRHPVAVTGRAGGGIGAASCGKNNRWRGKTACVGLDADDAALLGQNLTGSEAADLNACVAQSGLKGPDDGRGFV